jgi:hypothetical protein
MLSEQLDELATKCALLEEKMAGALHFPTFHFQSLRSWRKELRRGLPLDRGLTRAAVGGRSFVSDDPSTGFGVSRELNQCAVQQSSANNVRHHTGSLVRRSRNTIPSSKGKINQATVLAAVPILIHQSASSL